MLRNFRAPKMAVFLESALRIAPDPVVSGGWRLLSIPKKIAPPQGANGALEGACRDAEAFKDHAGTAFL